jgi:hypothetical protein
MYKMHVYLFIQEYGVHDYMYRYKLKEEILNIHAPIICTNKRMDRVWCLASLSTISVISWRPVEKEKIPKCQNNFKSKY